MKLRDYQEQGVNHLANNQRALLADDQGLGKTAQALSALDKLGPKKALVICPPAVRYGWEAEANRWTTRGYKVHVMTKENEWLPDDAQIIVCSDSLLSSPMIVDQLKQTRWGVTIVDEIHRFKSTKANRTQVVLGGRSKGIINNSVYFWGLSGTPMTARPLDLWPMFRSMGKQYLPKNAQDYMGFTKVFCKRYKTRWGHYDCSGASNIGVLHKALFERGFALRRTKDEVLSELPDKQYRIVPMDLEDKTAEAKWGEKIRSADLSKSTCGIGAAELAEIMKDVGHVKIPAIVEYIKELNNSVVVFGRHREFLERIASETNSVLYYGGMTPKQKQEALDKFKKGEVQCFVANITSAGTGLDGLQHVSHHAIFAEFPWNYSELAQAADRLHRMGQQNKVLIDLMVQRGGLESYVLHTILHKEKITKDLLDEQEVLNTLISKQ